MDNDETITAVVEQLVVQVEDEYILDEDVHDTDQMTVPTVRATTFSEWPPEPPLPAPDGELAVGTITGGEPVRRNAGIYAAVRRPTTSGD